MYAIDKKQLMSDYGFKTRFQHYTYGYTEKNGGSASISRGSG